jgi:multicomponent Na+:H+ antiporter subunit G
MMVILEWLSGLCLLLGGVLCITGGVGLLRMPDFFSRVHASGVTETLAAPLLLSGLLLQMELSLDSVKVIMILILVLATNPTATHAMAKATLHGGQRPLEFANDKDIGGDGLSKP